MNFLLNMIYPSKCPLCGILLAKGELVCAECARIVRPISGPRCKKCGNPLALAEQEFCQECMRSHHYFTRGISVFRYTGSMRRAVWRFKYKNRRCYGEFFSETMWAFAGDMLKKWAVDAVIPIPLHPKRQRQRGFNQAYLLAAPIAGHLGIPVWRDGLIRMASTSPQKNLDAKKRQINLKRAFKIGPNDVKLKKILLVDDIYTTGSTVDAAAEVLLAAGAKEVYFLALCTAGGEDSVKKPHP